MRSIHLSVDVDAVILCNEGSLRILVELLIAARWTQPNRPGVDVMITIFCDF
jgi:hypothetical protein